MVEKLASLLTFTSPCTKWNHISYEVPDLSLNITRSFVCCLFGTISVLKLDFSQCSITSITSQSCQLLTKDG